jgi:aminoglycoside phosphotransferase (APT) family kinase protein
MAPALHSNELPISLALVQRLIESQFPQWADEPLQPLESTGSTNLNFRLGEDKLVRLPRQPGGGEAISREAAWTPLIAEHVSPEVPRLMGSGEPQHGYPESWAITCWLPGTHPAANSGDTQLAVDLADAIHALRAVPLVRASGLSHYRGAPLAGYDRKMQRDLSDCRRIPDLDLDLTFAAEVWQHAVTLPAGDTHAWYHGDLVAENLLMKDGRLTGILDFGGAGIGDPTVDLHGAWELFDDEARAVFRARLAVSNEEWMRARAWALAIALSTFTYYWATMPSRVAHRLTMACNVLTDARKDAPFRLMRR